MNEILIFTTTKEVIYDAHSKTVLKNRLRIGSGGNFVIRGIKLVFYIAHSKTVITVLECQLVTIL